MNTNVSQKVAGWILGITIALAGALWAYQDKRISKIEDEIPTVVALKRDVDNIKEGQRSLAEKVDKIFDYLLNQGKKKGE